MVSSGYQPVIHPWALLERVFDGRKPLHANQFGLGKRHWNRETSSAVVEFLPPYHKNIICSSLSRQENVERTLLIF